MPLPTPLAHVVLFCATDDEAALALTIHTLHCRGVDVELVSGVEESLAEVRRVLDLHGGTVFVLCTGASLPQDVRSEICSLIVRNGERKPAFLEVDVGGSSASLAHGTIAAFLDARHRVPERRRCPRSEVHFPMIYTSRHSTFDGEARNLSLHGAFIATDLFDEPGTTCSLMFLATTQEDVEIQAVVRYVRSEDEKGGVPGIGVEFLEPSARAQAWIGDTLARAGRKHA